MIFLIIIVKNINETAPCLTFLYINDPSSQMATISRRNMKAANFIPFLIVSLSSVIKDALNLSIWYR
jgi:hypothetical protein